MRFDADAFMKAKPTLKNSSEAKLESLQSDKDDVAVDLHWTVYNYAEFVRISKEISTLENAMLELKGSLCHGSRCRACCTSTTRHQQQTRRDVRSSLADVCVLYAGQMQALHAQIEGSAKDGGIVALNAATYKHTHNVRFVLLDDAVLVARRRLRRATGESERLGV